MPDVRDRRSMGLAGQLGVPGHGPASDHRGQGPGSASHAVSSECNLGDAGDQDEQGSDPRFQVTWVGWVTAFTRPPATTDAVPIIAEGTTRPLAGQVTNRLNRGGSASRDQAAAMRTQQ